MAFVKEVLEQDFDSFPILHGVKALGLVWMMNMKATDGGGCAHLARKKTQAHALYI